MPSLLAVFVAASCLIASCYGQSCCLSDIIFVIDITDGTGYSRVNCQQHVAPFLKAVINGAVQSSCDAPHAALVEYGKVATIRFNFLANPDTASLLNALGNYVPAQSLGSPTNPQSGFQKANILLTDLVRGRRSSVPAFVFWIVKTSPADGAALQTYVNNNIKGLSATVVVIAVGDDTLFGNVKPVATSSDYAYHTTDIINLEQTCSRFTFPYCPWTTTKKATTTAATTTTKVATTTTKAATTTTTAATTTTKAATTTTKAATTTTTKRTTTAGQTTIGNPTVPNPPNDASAYCFQCKSRRNQKDLYADPTECHHYYQCLYVNDTFATGIRRVCPPYTFWHDQILQCMPELPGSPCIDPCTNDATSAQGYYLGVGCRQFFVCANTASYAMCCPDGTTFDMSTVNCEPSDTCHDPCTQQLQPSGTTVKPPSFVNATVCKDSWGTLISIVPGAPYAYNLLDIDGNPTLDQLCPSGIEFNLTSCRCDIETGITLPPPTILRQALLWIPLDVDDKDHSVNKWATFLYDGATRDTTTGAQGGASLYVNGGHVSIPGLKTVDLQANASWCAFFRCESGPSSNPFLCSTSGGILSNNKDSSSSEFTIIMATSGGNSFTGLVNFWHLAGSQQVHSASIPSTPSNGWNHVCVTYNGNLVSLYLNGAVADSEAIGGHLAIAHCPYVIGNDQAFGQFNGHIDDILITPFAMTLQEITAHRTGDRAYLISRGFFTGS